jgi:hypothetical protein
LLNGAIVLDDQNFANFCHCNVLPLDVGASKRPFEVRRKDRKIGGGKQFAGLDAAMVGNYRFRRGPLRCKLLTGITGLL